MIRLIKTVATILIGASSIHAQSPNPVSGNMNKITIFGFSQSDCGSSVDPQVVSLHPNIIIRSWSKWKKSGTKLDDFNQTAINMYKQKNILLIGGLTATVYFFSEASDSNEFRDMVTRNANNELVNHSYIDPDAYRGNMANPKFRQYIIKIAKVQIDAGVDGIFFDEANAGYSGNTFDGNEGFDDYHLKDFNHFLANKHPDFTYAQWCDSYKMDSSDFLDSNKPLDDLEHNFNYRTYLKKNGWNNSPFSSSNPLANVWGYTVSNRPDIDRNTFVQKYTIDVYWKEIVTAVRDYARTTYGKEILITSNGIFPYVDFNSVGLYNYNSDDNGNEAKYVPVRGTGRLDGTVSLGKVFTDLYHRNEAVSGNVPCALFIDWPTDMVSAYYAFTPSEKMDYWRIYAPEAYAHGLFFSFHLRTSIPGDPTAFSSGVLDSLINYVTFYKSHRDLFEQAALMDTTAATSVSKITTSFTSQPLQNRYLLHLVNHNYDGGIKVQQDVNITIPLMTQLKRVVMYSPDRYESSEIPFQNTGISITCILDTLKFYTILSLEYGDSPVIKRPAISKTRGKLFEIQSGNSLVTLQGKRISDFAGNHSNQVRKVASGVYINEGMKRNRGSKILNVD